MLLSKNEKAFCAGADIVNFPKQSLETELNYDPFEDITTALNNCKKPILVGCQG